jgi:hypothetical protein
MANDATVKMETKPSVKSFKPGTGLFPRGFTLGNLWQLIPDVSLRTRTGLAALTMAALIGGAASLGAMWMVAGSEGPRLLAAYIVSVCRPPVDASSRDDSSFMTQNRAAMMTMMAGMNIKPSGEVDHDFVGMMVPHHQGAIDMATAVLRYGHNEKIRRLAQEIIVTQQQEIAAMRMAVGEPLPPAIPSPTGSSAASSN